MRQVSPLTQQEAPRLRRARALRERHPYPGEHRDNQQGQGQPTCPAAQCSHFHASSLPCDVTSQSRTLPSVLNHHLANMQIQRDSQAVWSVRDRTADKSGHPRRLSLIFVYQRGSDSQGSWASCEVASSDRGTVGAVGE